MQQTQIIWYYDSCFAEAKKYVKRSHFKNACPAAYNSARKNGWLDSICSHMDLNRMQKIMLWSNFEECKKEAQKYKNRSDFQARNKIAYDIAKENSWLAVFYEDSVAAQHSWWNDKERCKIEALKCKTRTEFCKKANGAYAASIKNGWLDEICSHMIIKWKKKYASKEGV